MTNQAFDKLNLECAYLGSALTNQGMRNLALALVFCERDYRGAHPHRKDARVDLIEWGVLRPDNR